MNSFIKALSLLILFGLISCTEPRVNKSKELIDFVSKNGKNHSLKNILVLTEDGCPNCNRSFALLLERQVANPKSLLIVSALGNYVDISTFLINEERNNVLYDFKGEYKQLNISEGTSAIFMNENWLIDTIIPIRAKGISETLEYINNRIQI